VATRDLRGVSSLLNPNVVLRSPVAFKPFSGADSVARILSTVSEVLTDFQYEREFVSIDGHSVALEFRASVGGKQLKGVDLLRFDERGTIVELEVLVRPINALQALGAGMARRMGISRTQIFLARWLGRLRRSR
jgi:SnoaL-like protein